ncbi:MAG: glycosyltransferase [Deltaproteobacteria bacterium]|nr:glycosyltransferase [Deltaproteobacteria bacterium]
MPRFVLVVPCYNEAGRLDVAAFRAASTLQPELCFIFVNDGSTDGTLALLEALARELPERVRVVDLPKNVGKGEAVRQGMLSAFSESVEVVGFWDADLSAPLSEVGPMRDLLVSTGAEIVMGARVKLLGREISRLPSRHYLGRVFATAASWVLEAPVYDTQCGAKLFRNSELNRSLFLEPFESRWIVDVEILARLIRALSARGRPATLEGAVVEYPLHAWRHVAGSKVRPKDFGRAFFDLVAIRRSLKRRA